MRHWQFAMLLMPSIQCATAHGQNAFTHLAPTQRQLNGLNENEASGLIARLKEAQSPLKLGELLPFELLAGSVASYEATKITPKDAFLSVPFDEVRRIERVRTDNPLWQPHKLAYAPNGSGQLYWDIEVILGMNGNIERVLIVYKPPAPF